MESLKELIGRCAASVTIRVNYHKDLYQTVESYMQEQFSGTESNLKDEVSDEVYAKMVELDSVVEIQFYPRTPIGSYTIYHYDIDLALKESLAILDKK